jgi:glycosyltransferase involved in cell wall biosynthesis
VLSIIIIGKNEGANLPQVEQSVRALVDFCSFPVEVVYVDSASSDDSVRLARQFCDKVIELEESDRSCASAGRYIGTLNSTHPWLLYLDADMEVREEFFPIVQEKVAAGSEYVGFIGTYIHHFDDGSSAVQEFNGEFLKSDLAAHFGGAVLLRKDPVLQAGNWDPGVFGKEEMNLYTRLGNGDRVVRCIDVPMVNHHSEYYTRFQLFVRLLYPGGGQGKVFYGFGQSLHALLKNGKLLAYLRLDAELTIFWALLIFGLVLAPLSFWGVIFIAVELLMLSIWMGPGTVMRFSCLVIPLITGWTKYQGDIEPKISNIWAKSAAASD